MAEVKVKITAQNEVRTGLQQALQETQKFSQEAKRAVSQTMTINPFATDDRLGPLRDLQQQARALRERARAPFEGGAEAQGGEFAQTSSRGASAIRGLAADLANATSAGDVFEAVVRRISTAFGGLVAAAGGFAIGSLIRRTLEDAAAGLEGLIDKSQSLQQSFAGLLAPTTTFDQLATAIQGASQNIESLIEANRKLQSGIGFQIADYINAFDLSATANRETDQGGANARLTIAAAIQAATLRENELAKARTDEERKLIALQAQREQLLVKARGISGQAEQNLRAFFAAQDGRLSSDGERQEAEARQRALRSIEQETDLIQARNRGDKAALESLLEDSDFQSALKSTNNFQAAADFSASRATERRNKGLGPEFGPGTADAALGGFRVDQSRFAREQQEEALKILQAGPKIEGGIESSGLQRIGFSSNEFFDTRRTDDPLKRAADDVRKIAEILRRGEPLVLPASN